MERLRDSVDSVLSIAWAFLGLDDICEGAVVVVRFIGFLWALPAAIVVWAVYVLPLWAIGAIECKGSPSPWVISFQTTGRPAWYWRLWSGWWGWGGPCVLIVNHETPPLELKRLIKHELRHCWQSFVLGPFHYPLYMLFFVALGIGQRLGLTWRHPYHGNPFERDALKAEGR